MVALEATPLLYLVLGCHRSGTSATAGALQRLGVEFGPDLMPPSPANPRGYYEDRQIVALHDRLLGLAGCSWDNPPDHLDPVVRGVTLLRARQQVAAWLEERKRLPLIGVKDPRLVFFPSLWMEAASHAGRRVGILIVERSKEAVVKSLAAREGWPEGRALELWGKYDRALGDWTWDPRYASVSYERLLEDPFSQLGVLGFDGDWSAVGEFLTEDLNHG